MSEEELSQHVNPDSLLSGGMEVVDLVSRPVPPGSKAPPRPAGRERVPGSELPITEPFEIIECRAIPVPPGTKAPPRPPGRERTPSPAIQPPVAIDALVGRIETALTTIQDALTQIKQLHHTPAG